MAVGLLLCPKWGLMPEMCVWGGRVAGCLVVGVVVDGGVVAGWCAGVVGTRGEGFVGWWLVVAGEVAYRLVGVD